MKTVKTFIAVWVFCLVVTAAGGHTNQYIGPSIKTDISTKTENSSDACREWQRRYDALGADGHEAIRKYGIEIHANGEKTGGYVLNKNLVKDCSKRLEIGEYIYRAKEEAETDKDRQFVSQNSALVVSVLEHVWNAPNMGEKDLLLAKKELRTSAIAPFIGGLMRKNAYNSGLVYANIERPIAALRPTLIFVLNRERRRKDVARQVYALIALQKIDGGFRYIPELRKFIADKRVSKESRQGIARMIKMFERHQNVTYRNVEDLGLAIED